MLDFKQAPRFKLAPLLQLEIKNNYPTSTKPPPLPLNLPQEKNEVRYSVQCTIHAIYSTFNECDFHNSKKLLFLKVVRVCF